MQIPTCKLLFAAFSRSAELSTGLAISFLSSFYKLHDMYLQVFAYHVLMLHMHRPATDPLTDHHPVVSGHVLSLCSAFA